MSLICLIGWALNFYEEKWWRYNNVICIQVVYSRMTYLLFIAYRPCIMRRKRTQIYIQVILHSWIYHEYVYHEYIINISWIIINISWIYHEYIINISWIIRNISCITKISTNHSAKLNISGISLSWIYYEFMNGIHIYYIYNKYIYKSFCKFEYIMNISWIYHKYIYRLFCKVEYIINIKYIINISWIYNKYIYSSFCKVEYIINIT